MASLSIIFGAFGAHMFEDYLISIKRVDTFDTALKYQFYHVFFLLFLGVLYDSGDERFIKYAFYFCIIGIFLFIASLMWVGLPPVSRAYWTCLTRRPAGTGDESQLSRPPGRTTHR